MSSASRPDSSSEEIDITVLIRAHDEGPLLTQSLRSVGQAVAIAQAQGLRCETVVVLDRSDEDTRAVAETQVTDERLIVCDFADPANAYNFALEHARGTTLTLLNATAMIGSTWLARGYDKLREEGFGNVCVHPEATVTFGAKKTVVRHFGMDNPGFDVRVMMFENYFSSLALAPAQVYRRVPFRTSGCKTGFGHHDWTWINDTIEVGIRHVVAPQTLHVVRRPPQAWSSKGSQLPLPSALFSRPRNMGT